MQVSFTLTSRVSLTDKHKETIERAARHGAIAAANKIEEQVAMRILGVEKDAEE